MSLYAIFARLFPVVAQTIMRRLLERQQRKIELERQRNASPAPSLSTSPYRDGFDASGVPVSLAPTTSTPAGDAVPLDKSKD